MTFLPENALETRSAFCECGTTGSYHAFSEATRRMEMYCARVGCGKRKKGLYDDATPKLSEVEEKEWWEDARHEHLDGRYTAPSKPDLREIVAEATQRGVEQERARIYRAAGAKILELSRHKPDRWFMGYKAAMKGLQLFVRPTQGDKK